MEKDTRTWAFKDGEAKMFDSPEDVPSGWSDSPASAPEKSKTQEAGTYDEVQLENMRTEAVGLGIEVDGRWGASRLRTEIDKAVSNDDGA